MDITVKSDARDVNFWYGDFHALKGISMDIEEKSVIAFIGPSGCGKGGKFGRCSSPSGPDSFCGNT